MTEQRYREKLTITLERRKDGGLYVSSDEVPGLILSGRDPAKVMATVVSALIALKAWYP